CARGPRRGGLRRAVRHPDLGRRAECEQPVVRNDVAESVRRSMIVKTLRNRIKRHVTVRAGELVPHELNPRVHPESQRAALLALYEEIGFARSLLAYELPDGRLKLIDGHLRASFDPEQQVEVEVLDVSDAEARKLLLAIDPLA